MSSKSMMTTMAIGLMGLVMCGISCMPPSEPPAVPAVPDVPSKESSPEPKVEAPPAVLDADLKALAAGNNAFAIDLYKQLATESKGNIVVSPYSIRTELAMTYAGARGETAEEMRKTLHFDLPDERLHAAFAASMPHFAKSAGTGTLDIANALWLQHGVKLADSFVELTRRHYAAGVRSINFRDNEAARQTINGWVAEKTRDKIPELLKELDSDTQLVLTNAVYLNCKWATPFPKANTQDGAFESEPGKSVKVPLMRHTNSEFRIASTPEFQMLELPYEGNELSMWVILPVKRGGLSEVVAKLDSRTLADTAAKMSKLNVTEVVMPRFKVGESFDLEDTLKTLGMPHAFSLWADFSGMFPDKRVKIAQVRHEAVVEVDEQGTMAAAATAVAIQLNSGSIDLYFRADHPFLYLIVDRQTQSILFMGRVVNPK